MYAYIENTRSDDLWFLSLTGLNQMTYGKILLVYLLCLVLEKKKRHTSALLVGDGSCFDSRSLQGTAEGDDRSWWWAKARLVLGVPSPSCLLPPPPAHMGREIALNWRCPSHPSPRPACPARQPWHHAGSNPSGFTVTDRERGDEFSVYHLIENKHARSKISCHTLRSPTHTHTVLVTDVFQFLLKALMLTF